MKLGSVAIFAGSGMPSMSDLRYARTTWRTAFSDIFSTEVVDVVMPVLCDLFVLSDCMAYTPLEAWRVFSSLVADYDAVVVACGGCGAFRVANLAGKSLHELVCDAESPVVLGGSDGFVYPLLSFLSCGCGFYGPNACDVDNFDVIDVGGSLRELYGKPFSVSFYDAVPVCGLDYDGSEWSMNLFPSCASVLASIQGSVRNLIINELRSKPYFLMLEDDVPDKYGMRFLYHVLSLLQPYLDAVGDGDGMVSFCSVGNRSSVSTVGSLVRSMGYSAMSNPFFYGVDFGHSGLTNVVFPIGGKAAVRYSVLDGLSVVCHKL